MPLDSKQNISREKRHGLVIVNTGNGKGKTTAALGTAFRSLGWGWKVLMIQFIKGSWNPGEKRFIKSNNFSMDILSMGHGFTWESKDLEQDKRACEEAWNLVADNISTDKYDLIILDEINIALSLGYLKLEPVLDLLKKRPQWLHVILTGRNAPDGLKEYADLVSEIKAVKHPFDKGIKAQKGIDF